MSTLVSRFDKSQHGVHVSIVETKASSKLEAAIAAGDPPVLAEISHYDGVLVKAGVLVSWNKFIGGDPTLRQASLAPVVWRNGEVGSQHYRLEADLKVSEVFYNETMFAKAGIKSPPKTWAELAVDAAKVKLHLHGVIPIGWKDSSAHILPAFLSDGGHLLAHSDSVGHSVDFATSAGVRSFSWFRSAYSKGELVFDHGTALREDLAAGHMAMIDGTSAGYAKLLAAVGGKFKVGAFVEPAGSTGHAYNIAQGLGFVLPKGHTVAQDRAAATFVRWWFEVPQQVYWAEATGFAPETRAAAAAVPAAYLSSHPGLAASLAAVASPFTYPRPVSDSYSEVQASLDAIFEEVVTGKSSVTAGLAELDKQGDAYMSGASEL